MAVSRSGTMLAGCPLRMPAFGDAGQKPRDERDGAGPVHSQNAEGVGLDVVRKVKAGGW